MIIKRISNGLGNQMFQYALGRALSLRSGAELVLDISSFNHQKPSDAHRAYSLNVWSIQGRIARSDDFRALGIPNPDDYSLTMRLCRVVIRKIDGLKPVPERRFIVESSFDFDPRILEVRDNAYLAGVWQSEKYFNAYANEIRKDFQLSVELSDPAKELLSKIASEKSASIHVRRGDQIHNPCLLEKHGDLPNVYYHSAVELLKDRTELSRMFVFSDEIGWCENNLRFDVPTTFVHAEGLRDYEEMVLMSRCDHNVIAKSSYSWWGAWLNPNEKKIVIAPKERFGENSIAASDLIPNTWIQV